MTDMTDWDEDILGGSETDGGVIDLTDIVDTQEAGTDNIIDLTDISESDDVIELTDVVESDPVELEQVELDPDEFDGAEFDLDIVTEDSLEFEVEPPVEPEIEPQYNVGLDAQVMQEQVPVSQEQFEAALERVIEKKFADKIESILFEVMEKVMGEELASIKKSLQQDLDQIGND